MEEDRNEAGVLCASRCGEAGFFLDSSAAASARLRSRILHARFSTLPSRPLELLRCTAAQRPHENSCAARAGPNLFTVQQGGFMKKYLAELVGTFILVLFGCGTAVIAGDKVGILGIAFAFGLGLVAAVYGIGPDLRLPRQSRGQPGCLCCGADVGQGHDRLLGGTVCGRDSCGLGAAW